MRLKPTTKFRMQAVPASQPIQIGQSKSGLIPLQESLRLQLELYLCFQAYVRNTLASHRVWKWAARGPQGGWAEDD